MRFKFSSVTQKYIDDYSLYVLSVVVGPSGARLGKELNTDPAQAQQNMSYDVHWVLCYIKQTHPPHGSW